ncbi:MAG: hypothetical protein ACREF4_08660 [Gammaproteobacteria bacterium]
MAVIQHGVGAEDIPCNVQHAFLCENNGLGGGLRITDEEGSLIAARWSAWFLTRNVPHICELDDAGRVRQIYRHYWYGKACCPVVAQLRRPRGSPRRVTATEATQ